jgi:hypothetical protein
MKTNKRPLRIIALIVAALIAALSLSACTDTEAGKQRKADNAAVKQLQTGTSLEKTQLTERLKRQNKSTAIGYVYLLNFGKPFGYYVIKGKVSNAGSQIAPEQEIIKMCDSCDRALADGPQDDGTYGQGDPGIFFFTTSGTMVETSIDYIFTDQPMDIDVPVLGK